MKQTGIARWVGWQLHASDLVRADDFRKDPVLATNVVRIKLGDYAGSGFERNGNVGTGASHPINPFLGKHLAVTLGV